MSEKINPSSVTAKEFHEAVDVAKNKPSKLTIKLGEFVSKFLVNKMSALESDDLKIENKSLKHDKAFKAADTETKLYEPDYDPFNYDEKITTDPLGYGPSYDAPYTATHNKGPFPTKPTSTLLDDLWMDIPPPDSVGYTYTTPPAVIDSSKLVEDQIASELSYDIAIQPAPADAELTSAEIIELMEVDHAVKQAPRFSEQLKDTTRTNKVTYLADSFGSHTTGTSHSRHNSQRRELSEHEMLVETEKFFKDAIALGEHTGNDSMKRFSQSILDNLTFIGEKEYKEAAKGIATYWKALLERNSDQQILVLAGEIAKKYGTGFHDESGKVGIKSDDYLLDNILSNFTDEEVEKYKGRLVMSVDEIKGVSAKDLKVVFLDDWTISGSQLNTVVENFKNNYPHYASCPEIQLIVSNDTRATRGLAAKSYSSPATSKLSTPVRSYYRAHYSEVAENSAHITGSHSSVDFDFENNIEGMLYAINDYHYKQYVPDFDDPNSQPYATPMPPMTNIVRPYRANGYTLTQKDRFATKASLKKEG